MSIAAEGPFKVERLGVVMRPDPTREEECEGVLNPGAARGPDGERYLFPRIVGKKNFSRIGIVRVIFEGDIPVGVERLGYAFEPEEPYELRPQDGTGGCEDPRVTYVEPLGLYVMAYAAWGPKGPRIALAISENLLKWERLGLGGLSTRRRGAIWRHLQRLSQQGCGICARCAPASRWHAGAGNVSSAVLRSCHRAQRYQRMFAQHLGIGL